MTSKIIDTFLEPDTYMFILHTHIVELLYHLSKQKLSLFPCKKATHFGCLVSTRPWSEFLAKFNSKHFALYIRNSMFPLYKYLSSHLVWNRKKKYLQLYPVSTQFWDVCFNEYIYLRNLDRLFVKTHCWLQTETVNHPFFIFDPKHSCCVFWESTVGMKMSCNKNKIFFFSNFNNYLLQRFL